MPRVLLPIHARRRYILLGSSWPTDARGSTTISLLNASSTGRGQRAPP